MYKLWCRFHASFHASETILIARVKFLIGSLFTALQQSGVDIASFIEDHRWQVALRVFMAWLIVDGTLGEWARRRKAEFPDEPPSEKE